METGELPVTQPTPGPGLAPDVAPPESAAPPAALLPTLRSPDGRFVLTDAQLRVEGQAFGLRELERADVGHVRWVLWVLLGALGLATVLIAFLQNWLRTMPAAAGIVLTTLLLAYGQRGTNRLRLWRLGPSPSHFALPGELASWQRLVGELNRRIARAHDHAAAEAAALLATREAARAAEAAALATVADPAPLPPNLQP